MNNRVAMLVAATLAATAEVATGDVEWKIENDRNCVYFNAKADGLEPVALFLNPDGQGTRVFRLVFGHEGAVREAVAQDNNLGADSFDVSEKWRSGASCSTERTAKGWALTAEIPV